MARPFLFYQNRQSTETQVSVWQYINGELIQIGSYFGTKEATSSVSNNYNKVAHWKNNLYTLNGPNLYIYNPASGDWIYHATLPGSPAGSGAYTGFHSINISGVQYLISLYNTGSATFRAAIIDKNEEMIISAEQSVGFAFFRDYDYGFWDTEIFKNKFYFSAGNVATDGGKFVKYDPEMDTTISVLMPHNSEREFNITTINNDLFITAQDGIGGQHRLYKIEGTDVVEVAILGSISNTTASRGDMFTDGTSLFIIERFSSGWQFLEVNPTTYAITDRTSNVFSTTLQNRATDARWWHFIDTESNPGGAPKIYIFNAKDSSENSTVYLYEFIDVNTQLQFIGDGANGAGWTVPMSDHGDGMRTWSADNELFVRIDNPSVNGSLINFDVMFYGNNQNINAKFYFTKEHEILNNEMTLSSTTSGSIVSNAIVGIQADNFSTVTVTWNATADGVVAGDFPMIVGRVFEP